MLLFLILLLFLLFLLLLQLLLLLRWVYIITVLFLVFCIGYGSWITYLSEKERGIRKEQREQEKLQEPEDDEFIIGWESESQIPGMPD